MALLNAEQLINHYHGRKSDQEFEDFQETIQECINVGIGDRETQVIHWINNLIGHKGNILKRKRTNKRDFKTIFNNQWLFGDLQYISAE